MKHVHTISRTPAQATGDIPLSAIITAISSILSVIGTLLADKGT